MRILHENTSRNTAGNSGFCRFYASRSMLQLAGPSFCGAVNCNMGRGRE
ncbi:hypothetical protein CLOSYM_03708 [[Clostridium] symbiosum ATCC 14940]|uniref:Uncharacterized protein n=1 Tax=[Clostridium] symbiosum ATCC 14940 TaxID=411472 RepID=A0ABC9TTU0_CLOSY|nr:hypothetical protein CLOSYM_03708 [[Clostridium] symbiosum ATCC 14940]